MKLNQTKKASKKLKQIFSIEKKNKYITSTKKIIRYKYRGK